MAVAVRLRRALKIYVLLLTHDRCFETAMGDKQMLLFRNLTTSFIKLLFANAILLFVAGCGSDDPDCASDTTAKIIENISKTNDNKLAPFVLQTSEQFIGVTKHLNTVYTDAFKCKEYPEFCRLNDELYKKNEFADTPVNQNRNHDIMLQMRKITEEFNENHSHDMADFNNAILTQFAKARGNSTYSLSDIIMTDKNAETKRVSCKAKLQLTVPDWGGANVNVTYIVEKTADGKIVVELSGIQ
jgi:hypothetical protein